MTALRVVNGFAHEYVEARIKPDESGCWIWTGSMYPNGYGLARLGGRRHMAHRLVFELLREPIAHGLVLDHLCRIPRCVNPDHLEPVTQRENLLRGESPMAQIVRSGRCIRDHEMSGENLYVSPSGIRKCRECMRMLRRKRYLAYKQANDIPDAHVKSTCTEDGCDREHYGRGLCKSHHNRWYKANRQ